MKQITSPLTALMVGIAAVVAAAQSTSPQPPAVSERQRVAPLQSPGPTRQVVCGMTIISPDRRTDFKIREFTPSTRAPKFTLRTIPATPCERVVAPTLSGFALRGQERPTVRKSNAASQRFLFQP